MGTIVGVWSDVCGEGAIGMYAENVGGGAMGDRQGTGLRPIWETRSAITGMVEAIRYKGLLRCEPGEAVPIWERSGPEWNPILAVGNDVTVLGTILYGNSSGLALDVYIRCASSD
jgi:hypothetical protein